MQLKFLNKKEIKSILNKIKDRYGIKNLDLDYVFLKSKKGKVFIISKDVIRIDITKLKIDTIGMYFCKVEDDGIRLSIEGSQLIGKYARKNILKLNEKELEMWLSGEELDREGDGYYLIKGKDFVGSGKIVNRKLYNYVPKYRRT